MSQHAAAAGRSSAVHALNVLRMLNALLRSHTRIFSLILSALIVLLPANQIYIQTITNKLSFTGLAQNFEKFESIKESSKKNGSNNSFDFNSPEKNKK